jgi:isopenicillin-N N-acyltransferase-like protein
VIPRIHVEGDPQQRGRALGEALRERIRTTWEFYRDEVFGNPPFDLQARGAEYLAAIRAFRLEYASEIEAIAEGSGLEAWQIAALNARTEIMHHTIYRAGSARAGECTALYFPETGLLGQNWDWLDQLEGLMVLVEIAREDGHRILQLTEPGILGKIGFNSAGLGTCLNILSGRASPPAVPVHVLLRAILDARSLGEARGAVAEARFGTCSHILVGDSQGASLGIELYGDEVDFIERPGAASLHTNHYLARERDQSGDLLLPNSRARFERAEALLGKTEERSLKRLQEILLDRGSAPHAICAAWTDLGPFRLGTVCSLVMDLPRREAWITPGNPRDHAYERVAL